MNKKILISISLSICCLFTSVGQKNKNKEPKVAYLAAYMKGTDEKHLYYAIAEKDFLFEEINNGQPILSASFDDKLVRDPMVFKDEKGMYHMVATVSWKNRPFTIWDSKDLVNWKNERIVDIAPENSTKTWAPEIAYDNKNKNYFVYWTAEINKDWKTAAIYYSVTKDFKKFSKPQILFNDTDGILDANIIKVGENYNLLYRKNKSISVVTSTNATGPYTNPYQLAPDNVEGPYAFPLRDKEGYGLIWDYYGGSAGFGLLTSPDFKNWTNVTNKKKPYYNDKVKFPASIRHGSITTITQKELNKILKAYGNK